MRELLNAAVSPPNIILTGLLIMVLIYWVAVIVGMLDIDLFDLDIDVDGPDDADFSVSWLNHILIFFNLAQIPVMFFVTFLVIPMWSISIMVNHYLHNTSFLISLVFLIPNFIVCVFVAKFLTIPFVKFFAYLGKEEAQEEVIGKVCVAMVAISNDHIGQAKVTTKESPLLLNVRTKPGTTLKAGETGLIVEYMEDRNIYLIEPYETL